MTAMYLERFMNYGLTPEELRSGAANQSRERKGRRGVLVMGSRQ
jgi:hypothetical protein